MNKEISIEKVLILLRKWKAEAINPRNDGWVQKGYREKIKKVFNEAGSLLKK